jgi:virginiamycin B lyase
MGRISLRSLTALLALALLATTDKIGAQPRYFDVPSGGHPHDVAASPRVGGPVYYTAQMTGKLGILEPASGRTEEVPLGRNSAPHGVVVGPDGAAWVTDGGQNAIVRVDATTKAVRAWPLPREAANANLNTLTFDRNGIVWFTGQSGWYGRLDPAHDTIDVWKAPRGAGPYGIAATPAGDVYFVSLAGSYLARIDIATGKVTVIDPPTPRQGARRVWADSHGRLWLSYWNTGQVGMYDPATGRWREWTLPGPGPQAYAVWVDAADKVWLTEWSANTILRFDPVTEMQGRAGEAWGAESGNDRLVMIPAH